MFYFSFASFLFEGSQFIRNDFSFGLDEFGSGTFLFLCDILRFIDFIKIKDQFRRISIKYNHFLLKLFIY